MPVKKLKEFLDANSVKYITIDHSPAYTAREAASSTLVPRREFAKTVIVKIDDRMAMAVLPASRHVDLERLQAEAGGKDIEAKLDSFREMIGRVEAAYPGASVFATTLREVVSANCHRWGGLIQADGNFQVVRPREIGVHDRIGGGDGFVGGMLYAMLRGWTPEQWLQFGWASGAFVATLPTDWANPADEEQIWSIWEGNARVKR